MYTVDKEEWCAGNVVFFVAEVEVEIDFLGYSGADHIGLELIDIAGGCYLLEQFDEDISAFGAVGIGPDSLIGENNFGHFEEVALETGGFNSGSGSAGVGVTFDGKITKDEGDSITVFFK